MLARRSEDENDPAHVQGVLSCATLAKKCQASLRGQVKAVQDELINSA